MRDAFGVPRTRGDEPATALLDSPICQWGATRGQMTAMPSGDDLFKGRHFDREIFVLWVSGHLRY